MTTAPRLVVGTTGQTIDDTNFSVFQLQNAPGGTQLVCGNIFLGLQGYCMAVIPAGELSGFLRGGTIETGLLQPRLTLVADGTWTVGGTVDVSVMIDNGPKVAEGVDPVNTNLAWKPPLGFGPNWRRDFSGVFDLRLEDTGGTPFVDTGLGNVGAFGIRAIVGHREQLAHTFTVPAGPSWSVARAILELRRFGLGASPSTMEIAIQASASDGFGHVEPDGVDLAVTAAVLNSTIPLSPASGPITYAFTPDVVLAPGIYWSVIRPAISYPISVTDFIVWMQRRLFLGPGGSHFTPNGIRLDQGNYPGHVDVQLDTAMTEAGPSIPWAIPAATPGQTLQTPDLTPLMTPVLSDGAGHLTTSAVAVVLRATAQTRTFRFAAHGHPTRNPPAMAFQMTNRDSRADII